MRHAGRNGKFYFIENHLSFDTLGDPLKQCKNDLELHN